MSNHQPQPFNPGTAAASLMQVPGQSTLQLSGNTSATGFMIWTETTQTCDGWWQRQWEFADDPFVLSSCGHIVGSYILYHMNVQVNRLVGDQPFASGLTTLHDIDYWTDSVSGGWGTSGALYTASAGYTRVSGVYGPSGLCQRTWDATGMYLPGQYDLNSSTWPSNMDTSSYWNAEFNSKISLEALQLCPNWNPNIVVV